MDGLVSLLTMIYHISSDGLVTLFTMIHHISSYGWVGLSFDHDTSHYF